MTSNLKRKRHQKVSSSHKSSSNSVIISNPTPQFERREKSGKPGSTLAVNSILQELLGSSAGPSSTAYKKANSEANQGLKSTSHSYSLRPKAGKVSVFTTEKTVS